MTPNFALATYVLLTAALGEPGTVRIVDESGAAVDRCEAMWHTANEGYASWEQVTDGRWPVDFSQRIDCVDVIVRSEGFATTLRRFESRDLEALRNEGATLGLQRGRVVKVALQHPPGLEVPDDAVLHSSFPQFMWRIRMSWPPYNRRGPEPDWNLLNATRSDAGGYTLRLPADPGEFYLAYHHPGWLQFCELGPFTEEDIENDTLRVELPKPATIDVVFHADGNSAADRPFNESTLIVFYTPDSSGRAYGVTDHDAPIRLGEHVVFNDLGPGNYLVQVRTKPKEGDEAISLAGEINPGRYFEQERLDLRSGDRQAIEFSWVPFDPESYRGNARAEITILNPDGTAPAGKKATVGWFDGHYGNITVYEGPIPESGVLSLEGISGKRHRGAAPFGPYTVTVEEKRLGFLTLDDTSDVQKFEFTITPEVGDLAPDVGLIDVTTGSSTRLSNFRGKAVCLEFWGIGCGPCQPAMRELNEYAANHLPQWKDDVEFVSVSTDRDAEIIRDHAAGSGWTAIPHFMGERDDGDYFSKAEEAFVILGIPHAVVIDRDGRIAWRGHPMAEGFHEAIESLISP